MADAGLCLRMPRRLAGGLAKPDVLKRVEDVHECQLKGHERCAQWPSAMRTAAQRQLKGQERRAYAVSCALVAGRPTCSAALRKPSA